MGRCLQCANEAMFMSLYCGRCGQVRDLIKEQQRTQDAVQRAAEQAARDREVERILDSAERVRDEIERDQEKAASRLDDAITQLAFAVAEDEDVGRAKLAAFCRSRLYEENTSAAYDAIKRHPELLALLHGNLVAEASELSDMELGPFLDRTWDQMAASWSAIQQAAESGLRAGTAMTQGYREPPQYTHLIDSPELRDDPQRAALLDAHRARWRREFESFRSRVDSALRGGSRRGSEVRGEGARWFGGLALMALVGGGAYLAWTKLRSGDSKPADAKPEQSQPSSNAAKPHVTIHEYAARFLPGGKKSLGGTSPPYSCRIENVKLDEATQTATLDAKIQQAIGGTKRTIAARLVLRFNQDGDPDLPPLSTMSQWICDTSRSTAVTKLGKAKQDNMLDDPCEYVDVMCGAEIAAPTE